MQKSIRILALLALVALGIWGLGTEKVIRSRLNAVAKTVSFEPGEGTISKGYKAQKLMDYFTPDVEVNVNMKEYREQTFSGRDELIQAYMWFQFFFKAVKVELIDINLKFAPDKQSVVANLTLKVFMYNEREFTPQELNVMLKRIDKKWLI